jgi:hypothetical protein
VADPEQSVRQFQLTAPAPIRALAFAAAGAVVAMVLLIVFGLTDSAVVLVVGLVVLVLAIVMGVTALLLTRRLRTSVVLTADTLTVVQGGNTRTLAWAGVDEVGLRGRHLVLTAKPGQGEDLAVLNPRTRSDPAFLSLLTAVRDRLDADRGYGARPFG